MEHHPPQGNLSERPDKQDIVLTAEQAERLVRLEQAMTEIRINNLAALRSTELFANDITDFLAKENRPPGVQALLEKQAQFMLTTYADSLTKKLAERNAGILTDALTPLPRPVIAQSVAPAEPVRQGLSASTKRGLQALLTLILIPATLFMACVSGGLFFTNQRDGKIDGSPVAFILIILLLLGGWLLASKRIEDP